MRFTTLGGLGAHIVGDFAARGPVVVLLHGFGAPGEDLVPLARALGLPPNVRFVFPEGLIDIGFGRAWWMIDPAMLTEPHRDRSREVPDGLAPARERVIALLDDVERTMHPTSLVIGGFSQGAMVSCDVALRDQRPLAGLVLLSGTILAADDWSKGMPARRGLPVFMSHGTADPLLPFRAAEDLKKRLTGAGLAVEWHPFAGVHEIPMQVLSGLATFLGKVTTRVAQEQA